MTDTPHVVAHPGAHSGTIRVTIELLHDRFDAGSDGDLGVEWPPVPYRLFAALRAGAAGLRLTDGPEAETQAVATLERLESTPPPVVWASTATRHHHTGYVPVIPDFRTSNPTAIDIGKMDNRLKANLFPDITTTRGIRFYQTAFPEVSTIAFDIDGTTLSEQDVHWLRLAAQEIPYFGRSASPALFTVSAKGDLPALPQGMLEYRPGHGDIPMEVWTPGLLDALDDKHDALALDRPMWGRVHVTFADYHRPGQAERTWFAFEHDEAPYTSLPEAQTVLETLSTSLHEDDNLSIVANVGNTFANGRLGIVAFLEKDSKTVEALIAELATRGWRLAETGRWLQKQTWITSSDVFATAIPVRLSTRNHEQAHAIILKQLQAIGPNPQITVGRLPYLKGGVRLADRHYWHVAVRFESPIRPGTFLRRLGRFDGALMPIAHNQGPHHDAR